ncbi:hypothetical protein [Plantactinospora sonchi]|uniref:DUF2207 domain-containing protein n=1 Tax=Plantactinospora sonchi TaxID=1544735 RepID=A0ABU7RND9_9ACTN
MSEQPRPIATNAVAKMSSARLSLADLELVAKSIRELRRVEISWSSREMYTVTASNFSAQSPSIKVVRTFEVNSVAGFAAQAPRGKIYIMEARFESPDGTAFLTLGKDRDLSRDLLLRFEGVEGAVPSWFDVIVREIVSAKMLNAAQREFYLLCLTWAPVLLPPIAVPWAVATGRLPGPEASTLLALLMGAVWIAYVAFASTITGFIRASSLRVRPLFAAVSRRRPVTVPSPSQLVPSRLKDFRAEVMVAFKSGWLAFRQSDHQFNAVLIALMALVVSLATLIVEISK